eukprot:TRINITY_DN110760_c0_g1_i1.p1 TRINITY_DN110760_c0_g1~~TRINITY_DN110760_c0_g1_i1.p1  ORF type:complete len:729 (+),score=93.03 TRINITY_DN110760_c0_g1_i1:60-2246(+)
MFSQGSSWILACLSVVPIANGLVTSGGQCEVPMLNAFSCRDLPEWSTLLDKLEANAKLGYPLNPELFRQADDIVARVTSGPFEGHPPEGFYRYLCGGPDVTWPLPDRFCLLGFVAALFFRARHVMNAPDKEQRAMADSDLVYIEPILGKEMNLDFLDSSPWPVSILDVFININQTEFQTYAQHSAQNPVRPPAVSLESLHWKVPSEPKIPTKAMPAQISVAVFGTHATLSLEPVDILSRIGLLEVKPTFFGVEPRWCKILGMCSLGLAAVTRLLRAAEEDAYAYSWSKMSDELRVAYQTDAGLNAADVLLCTEPVAGCLMLLQLAKADGKNLPMLGYFGVALFNGCPPQDVDTFWQEFATLFKPGAKTALAVNNLILSEQIFYQSGKRLPYVRAHGLYTNAAYDPKLQNRVLFWRSPLFAYSTLSCAVDRVLEIFPAYPLEFQWVEETWSVPYETAAAHRAVAMLPHDHALMSFYELYSMGVPLLMPAADWMYRLLYMRGQLSVGERWYQSIMPGHEPPYCEFEAAEEPSDGTGTPDPAWGLRAAKAARAACDGTLDRVLKATDLETAKQMAKAAKDLMQDQEYFLLVASNETESDAATSMGKIRGSRADSAATTRRARDAHDKANPWHPYTPFQMSTRDSIDWTRMRKGGWWLRRGARFDAMRYWHQFSDFARFPGLTYFENIPDLLCQARSMDIASIATAMREYNDATLRHTMTFWAHALLDVLAS